MKGRLNTTVEMEIESPASPARSISATQIPTAIEIEGAPTRGHSTKSFVIHGVACLGPITTKIWEVERSFGKKGARVIGCRWLSQ